MKNFIGSDNQYISFEYAVESETNFQLKSVATNRLNKTTINAFKMSLDN